jgi:translocation and assembly module TamA
VHNPPTLSRYRAFPGPAFALFLLACMTLAGCATRAERAGKPVADDTQETTRLAFKVEVVSRDRNLARHLRRHLDIRRFTNFPDLQPSELQRLLGSAESNARDLLAALGYFNPQLNLVAGEAGGDSDEKRRIVIEVDPGPRTRVEGHEISFIEPEVSDAQGGSQRRVIERDWLLPRGEAFSQEQWDAAKAAGLRVLQRERYPAARIADSEATVNADTNLAQLAVTYETGASYRFGDLKLEGLERYDEQGIRNIARMPSGDVYREQTLLDTQQRMIASGYFDSVFLTLDASEQNPDEATVIAQLREARLQKLVFGVGYSSDGGARLTVDHTHNEMPPLGWRALNSATAGTEEQSLSTNWNAMPAASGWAWNTGLALERTDIGDIKANTLQLNAGRARAGDRNDQRYYLQYDASRSEGGNAPSNSTSLLAHYGWTGRHFDNRLNPTSGFGVGADAGVGMTLTPRGSPFVRLNARALQLLPFGGRNSAGKRSRIALRAEVGTILADSDVEIPAGLLFVTGGDSTVRGYGYQSIGTRLSDGSVYGARNMATASVEWQHPITLFGDAGSYEHLLFVDAGAAADRLSEAVIHPGVGTGVRWASPMGPLELDVAYGTRTGNWRLHLRVGFQFQ